jgi:DNA-binding PadR family transcriptional regulator
MVRRANNSRQTRTALLAFLDRPRDWRHGYDLMEQTGIASGTLYPMLIRLCDHGHLEARWVPAAHGRWPRRHAYRLTATGLALARAIQSEAESHGSLGKGLAI